MKRFKHKQKINSKRDIWFYLILILIEILITINYLGKLISPKLINIAKNNITYYDNLLVEEYLNTEELRSNLIDNLIILDKNKKDEIINININTSLAYQLMRNIVKDLKDNKNNKDLLYSKNKNDYLILRYPLGLASNNLLINNFGYKIPLKLELNSNVLTGLKTKVTSYGINNSLIEVYLKVSFTSNIVYFSLNEAINSNYEILLASKMVVGLVPNMFNGYLEKSLSSS